MTVEWVPGDGSDSAEPRQRQATYAEERALSGHFVTRYEARDEAYKEFGRAVLEFGGRSAEARRWKAIAVKRREETAEALQEWLRAYDQRQQQEAESA